MSNFGPPDAFPLIVGVTGHRDLRADHVPNLEAELKNTFARLRESYPHSSLVLLSPLAEGADRLAARVALNAGVRLIVPLPMPRELYETDFQTPASRSEFCELLERAEACIELPLLAGSTREVVEHPGMDRDREYAKVGAYVATYSHVFVALWDGVDEPENQHVGGTGQIVQFRLSGAPPPYVPRQSDLMRPSGGPVDHILTPRLSNPAVELAFTRSTLLPFDRSEESSARLLKRMDLFNRDAHQLRANLRVTTAKSKAQLLQTDISSISDVTRELPTSCALVLEQYAVADALSVHYGRKTHITSKQVFVAVCIAAGLLNLHTYYYHDFFGHGPHVSLAERIAALPWFLLGFLALSAFTALRLHGSAAKGEYQNKHQDYRALAEALRVQFFWLVAGIGEPVVHHYLRRHRSDLEWIRSALFSSWVLTSARTSPMRTNAMPWPDRLQFLQKHWITDQRRYYAARAAGEQRTLDKEKLVGGLLLKASLVLTSILAIAISAALASPIEPLEKLRFWVEQPGVGSTIEFLMVMFAVAGGLLLAYCNQMARSEHIRQFTRMSELFGAGEQELARLLRDQLPSEGDDVVVELGTEALDENGDWLILHRERPLELPHAG